jgi:hypothetical protein
MQLLLKLIETYSKDVEAVLTGDHRERRRRRIG